MNVPILKGENLILRPLRESDAPLFCRWFRDATVTRFLTRHQDPPSLREERVYLKQQQRRSDHAQWGIVVVPGGLIGTVGLDTINRQHRRAVYGIFIGEPRYWGQGHGTKAGRLAVAYGFRQLKLHRIMLHVHASNLRGLRSYRKIGFRLEGRLRDHWYRGRTFHDDIVMGLLKTEFQRRNREHIAREKLPHQPVDHGKGTTSKNGR